MVVGTLGLPVSPDEPCPFADVEDGGGSEDPLYPSRYVAVCADRGTTLGKTATSFDPYGHLTKAPLITMVARAADLVEPPADYAAPFDDFSQEHYPWARKAAYAGLLDGLSGANGPNFDFWEETARRELCLLLYHLPAIMRPRETPAQATCACSGADMHCKLRTTLPIGESHWSARRTARCLTPPHAPEKGWIPP